MIQELYGENALFVIISDHGYTELPKQPPILPVSGKTKQRCIEIEHQDVARSNGVWALGAHLFGLITDMAVSTNYTCFGSAPKGASHGGCTPQELAVPCLILSPSKQQPLQEISITVEGVIHRRRKQNPAYVNILNPNPYGVGVSQLQMKTIDISDRLPIHIEKEMMVKIPVNIDASEIQSGLHEISGEFTIHGFAETKSGAFTLKIQTAGAMSTEFDDDFDI